jgi:hypothetical protein
MELNMNRNLISRGALALCLLATPLLATADHHKDKMRDGDSGAQHQGKRHYDPVQRAEKHLIGLEKKLNLKAEQQTAWTTYSDAMMQRARDQAGRMKTFKSRRDEMRDLDTASKLERMAQWMRERADGLDAMAGETRLFQDSLTPEQQTIFDMYWEKHSRRGWGRGR